MPLTCPLDGRVTTGDCYVASCMYYSRTVDGRCRYNKLNAAVADVQSPSERIPIVARLFQAEEADVVSAIKNVKLHLAANAYFNFLFGKDVIDAKRSELLSAIESEARFQAWPLSKQYDFQEIQAALAYLNETMR